MAVTLGDVVSFIIIDVIIGGIVYGVLALLEGICDCLEAYLSSRAVQAFWHSTEILTLEIKI